MTKRQVKVGDHIRYLNAAGGGVVRRIEGKVAWVEGEDGFELPTPLSECIPVEESDSFIPGYRKPVSTPVSHPVGSSHSEKKERLPKEVNSSFPEPLKKEIPMPHLLAPERIDGDAISIYLGWLPVEPSKFGHTPIECYLINDCNYTLACQLWAEEGENEYKLIYEGEIERDTKLFVEELPLDQLSTRDKLLFSFIPFKRDKAFVPKPAQTLEVPLNVLRLLKKHAYTTNDFFDEDALVVPLIVNDKAEKEALLTPEELQTLADNMVVPQKDQEFEEAQRAKREKRIRRSEAIRQREIPLEVDLHIEQLVETTAGLSASDILNLQMTEFEKVMKDAIHNRGQKIVFIHGKGEGVLRKAILDKLQKNYPKATAQDASYKEYGFGATLVTIH